MSVPVTLVSGFLGSGKTSLINQVLKDPAIDPREIVIIENEVGDVGIDHQLIFESVEEIYQMNGGCVCCNLREDLMPILQEIKKVYKDSDHHLKSIIIETTGIADPQPIVQTIEVFGGVRRDIYVDSIFCVVDSINYQTSLKNYPEASEQIVFADKIYLSKLDHEDAVAEEVMQDDLRALNPFASFAKFSNDEPVEAEKFFKQGLHNQMADSDLEIGSQDDHDHQHHDHDHHDHHHGIETIYLESMVPLAKNQLLRFLDWLLMMFYGDVYRFKGILKFKDTEVISALQGVGMHYDFQLTNKSYDESKTQIVVIGKNLNRVDIQDAFNDMVNSSRQE